MNRRTVYVTVPVVLENDEPPTIDPSDDGEPGSWGNCWIYSESEMESGYWDDASLEDIGKAWDYVETMLQATQTIRDWGKGN